LRQFEIWWASLPAPAGRRPVLLLTRPRGYAYLNRVLVSEVTTHVRGIPQEVPLGRAEGVGRSCVANLDDVQAIPKAWLSARIGMLAEPRRIEVKRALGHALAWAELTSL
jgi:mRNA-degrading endonuclease toxin of MazEF toxin-antitoxin module